MSEAVTPKIWLDDEIGKWKVAGWDGVVCFVHTSETLARARLARLLDQWTPEEIAHFSAQNDPPATFNVLGPTDVWCWSDAKGWHVTISGRTEGPFPTYTAAVEVRRA